MYVLFHKFTLCMYALKVLDQRGVGSERYRVRTDGWKYITDVSFSVSVSYFNNRSACQGLASRCILLTQI